MSGPSSRNASSSIVTCRSNALLSKLNPLRSVLSGPPEVGDHRVAGLRVEREHIDAWPAGHGVAAPAAADGVVAPAAPKRFRCLIAFDLVVVD